MRKVSCEEKKNPTIQAFSTRSFHSLQRAHQNLLVYVAFEFASLVCMEADGKGAERRVCIFCWRHRNLHATICHDTRRGEVAAHSLSSLIFSPPSPSLLKPVLWSNKLVPALSLWSPSARIRAVSIRAIGSKAGGRRRWENMFRHSLHGMANGTAKRAFVSVFKGKRMHKYYTRMV